MGWFPRIVAVFSKPDRRRRGGFRHNPTASAFSDHLIVSVVSPWSSWTSYTSPSPFGSSPHHSPLSAAAANGRRRKSGDHMVPCATRRAPRGTGHPTRPVARARVLPLAESVLDLVLPATADVSLFVF